MVAIGVALTVLESGRASEPAVEFEQADVEPPEEDLAYREAA